MLSSTTKAQTWPLWCVGFLLFCSASFVDAAPATKPWHVSVRRLNGGIEVSFAPKLSQPMQVDASQQRSPLPGVDRAQRRVALTEAQTFLMGGTLRLVLPQGSHLQVRTLNGTIRVGPGAGSVDGYNLNGQILISGVSKWVRARTVNGLVQVKRAAAVEASSVSGTLELSRLTGRLLANTVSGTIQVSRCQAQQAVVRAVSGSLLLRHNQFRQLQAKTFSGSISALGPLGPKAQASLVTASGQVTFQGPLVPASHLTISSASGDVLLIWPKAHKEKLSLRASVGGSWMPPTPSPFKVQKGNMTHVAGLLAPPKAAKKPPATLSVQTASGDLSFLWR